MPKIYNDQDKLCIKKRMLHVGLERLARHGYKNTSIADIIQTAGVSKSLFYKMFPSKEQFVLLALQEQQNILCRMLDEAMSHVLLPEEERIYCFLRACVEDRENHIFALSQKDQMQIFEHLTAESYEQFQKSQLRFYTRLVELMGRDPQECSPQTFGNLAMLMLILRGPVTQSLPFLFEESLPDTSLMLAEAACRYLLSC